MNTAIYRLMVGFRKFREKYFQPDEHEHSFYGKLATVGQTPKTMLIGCSDSRVDPAILTGAAPGELFVVRNVANLVPPCETSHTGFHGTSSALEFAVVHLKVDNIIILGHRQCGGIKALMDNTADNTPGFIRRWMTIAEEAREKVLAEYADADDDTKWRMGEMEAMKVSIKNLKSFPFVQEAITNRNLNIIGIYFDLEQGKLWELDEKSQKFQQLEI